MTYHISLSQDGRSYTLLLFVGMTSLYFFIKHLNTSRKMILDTGRLLFLYLILYQLQLHSFHRYISNPLVLQTCWRSQKTLAVLLSHPERPHVAPLPSLAPLSGHKL